jgi:hypothetical protein
MWGGQRGQRRGSGSTPPQLTGRSQPNQAVERTGHTTGFVPRCGYRWRVARRSPRAFGFVTLRRRQSPSVDQNAAKCHFPELHWYENLSHLALLRYMEPHPVLW